MTRQKTIRWGLKGSAAAVALAGALAPAQAYETKFGDVSIIFDTTVSMGASIRTADRETQFLPESNGGPVDPRSDLPGAIFAPVGIGGTIPTGVGASFSGLSTGSNTYTLNPNNYDGSINSDDGRLNFDSGDLIGANVKANHDLQVTWENYKFFARAIGFYDVVMNDKGVGDRSQLTDRALGDVGRNYELLDAFVSADYSVADMPVNLRLGKQVINWGESTFILGGNNVFNPIDVGAFRRPGSEIKEALVPVSAISGSISLPFDVSISGYYALDWEPFEVDPSGTPFSSADVLAYGSGLGGNQMYSFVTGGPLSGLRRNCFAPAGSGTEYVQENGLVTDPDGGALGDGILNCNDFSNIDYASRFVGTSQERIRIGSFQDNPALAALDGITNVTQGLLGRGNDTFASDDGQFGISAKWYAEDLGGTEFAAYYQNYHSRLPFANLRANPVTGGYPQLGFFINGNNTNLSATAIGTRALPVLGCGLGATTTAGSIGDSALATDAGLQINSAIAALGNPLTPGTAAYQLVNTPVLDPTDILPTAQGSAALGDVVLHSTGPYGVKNALAVTALNCALTYYQSRQTPSIGAVQIFDGAEQLLAQGDGELYFSYPEDIEAIGASFNTVLFGWGVQGDFTYRRNAPFQVDTDSITIASLVNGCIFTQLYGAAAAANVNFAATPDGTGVKPRCGSGVTSSDGVIRNEMFTAQIGTTATFTGSDWWIEAIGADIGILVTEIGMVQVPDVEDTWIDNLSGLAQVSTTQYQNIGCQGTDLPLAGALSLDPKRSKQCRPNDFSAGLVLLLRTEYNNAFGTGFVVAPQIVYAYDFEGTTPAPYGNYLEDRQSVGLSVTGTLNNNFRVNASYSNFFGGHIANKSKDTDFASLTASYSF
jgi:Protein of unknown function (DUF1302)